MSRPADNITQMKVYQAILAHWEKHGYAPAFPDLMEATGIRSKSTIEYHLANLKDAGLINFQFNVSRSITLTGALWVPPHSQPRAT
jgi:SOS-response transcriptional repressor LexA